MAVNRGVFADADLLRLERALPRRATNAWHAAILEERVGAIWLCELARHHPVQFINLSNFIKADPPTRGPRPRTQFGVLWAESREFLTYFCQGLYRHSDFAARLDRSARREQACLLPLRERLSIFRRVDAEMLALDRKETCLAVFGLEPSLAPWVNADAVNQARLIAAHTAFAVERWRLAHEGRVPTTLAELVPAYLPAVPVDPFDDQPIRFQRLPQGYRVYSIGLDGTDNGGKEPSADAKGDEGYDVTFTIGR